MLFYRPFYKLIFISLMAIAFSSCYKSEKADLVVHNATIYSVNEGFETFDAMAITDGKIIELGAEREIMNRYSYDRKIDAQKRFVYPGFYDAHSHFLGYATNKGELNLYGCSSEKEMIEKVITFSEKSPREWIVGRGWDQNSWPGQKYPTNLKLDSLFPDRPVALTRVDGHATLANAVAIKQAGIADSTTIDGGKIVRNEKGEPTGIFIDKAAERIENAIAPLSQNRRIELLREAELECFEAGLTTVTDAGLPVSDVLFLDSLQKSGDLSIGIYAMLQPGEETLDFMEQGPYLTERLSARGMKLYADGALGSRGALLKKPYADEEKNHGLSLLADPTFNKYAEACLKYGYQLCTHCIGDSANAHVLSMYADKLEGVNDLRWRMEHAQVVSPKDRHIFGDYAIIPSMQPVHATSDMAWADERLGPERIKNAYALKSLKSQIGLIALGTDFPVEPISPIANFYAAVFRKNSEGQPEDGYRMEEALTREDALRGLTIWAALASFEEERKGSLEPGKQADFIILDRDLLKSSSEKLLDTRVVGTYKMGEAVFPQY